MVKKDYTNVINKIDMIALKIYNQLSSHALQNKSYEKYYDSLQLRMAELYQDNNKLTEAKEIYRNQLARNPDSADAIYNLCLIYEQENKWEEAFDLWKNFSSGLNPGSHYWFESRYHMAKALNQLGKNNKACEITTMIEVLYPNLKDEQFRKMLTAFQREVCGKIEK